MIKVAGVSVNQTPLDWEGNFDRISAAVFRARDLGIDLLCFPELAICGYGCEDIFHYPWFAKKCRQALERVIDISSSMSLLLGLPLAYEGRLFNTLAVIKQGSLAGFYPKHCLAADGVHYESRWFTPWAAGEKKYVDFEGQKVQIGPPTFQLAQVCVGLEICEDAWKASSDQLILDEQPDLVVNASASPFSLGKNQKRKELVLERSRRFDCHYLLVNLLGNECGSILYDGDVIIACKGERVQQIPRLRFQEWTMGYFDMNSKDPSRDIASGGGRQEEVDLGNLSSLKLRFEPAEKCGMPADAGLDLGGSSGVAFQEFGRAVPMGLFDYLRKSRSRGFVVSLSGGADSTLVALMVHRMVELVTRERGGEAFKNVSQQAATGDIRQITSDLLTVVYQRSENSSFQTHESATKTARAMGATFHEWDIDPITDHLRTSVEARRRATLNWETDGIALQNLQARARGIGAWLLANLENKILLCTSNRSELALGYCTMDGDTSGGLAPIAGVSKDFVRKWLVYAERELGYPFLADVNALEPTAELLPPAYHQADETELMKYDLEQEIENLVFRERKSPAETLQVVDRKRDKISTKKDVDKFFHLLTSSQWKRERMASSFHLDDMNLSPRSWFRHPVLCGPYPSTEGT